MRSAQVGSLGRQTTPTKAAFRTRRAPPCPTGRFPGGVAERRMISECTKAALADTKRRGVKLGGDHGARPERSAGQPCRRKLPPSSKSYRRPAVSHCGPLQRASRSAAFRQLEEASGPPFR